MERTASSGGGGWGAPPQCSLMALRGPCSLGQCRTRTSESALPRCCQASTAASSSTPNCTRRSALMWRCMPAYDRVSGWRIRRQTTCSSIRGDFLGHDQEFGFVIVHGHTPVTDPDMRSNRINIDTGAFATNRLTCLRIGQDGARVLEKVPNNRSEEEEERSSQREKSTSQAWVASESDPFAVLGVDRNATPHEIRAAYLRLAKELHPDARSQTAFADERLKAVSRAYQDLKDLSQAFSSERVQLWLCCAPKRRVCGWLFDVGCGCSCHLRQSLPRRPVRIGRCHAGDWFPPTSSTSHRR